MSQVSPDSLLLLLETLLKGMSECCAPEIPPRLPATVDELELVRDALARQANNACRYSLIRTQGLTTVLTHTGSATGAQLDAVLDSMRMVRSFQRRVARDTPKKYTPPQDGEGCS